MVRSVLVLPSPLLPELAYHDLAMALRPQGRQVVIAPIPTPPATPHDLIQV
ncbi:MAG: hypothetical protein V9G19_09290 [Tetrasphaera sp.]